MDSKKIKELKHQTRRLSIKEGMLYSSEQSFGNYFLKPFAIAIETSSSLVAFLSSINGLLGYWAQIFASRLIEKYPRKKILATKIFYESLMWLLLVFTAYLYKKDIIANLLPIIILAWYGIFSIITNIGYPAWFSWMGDVVDSKFRGRWFSKRTLLMSFVAFTLAIAASFFLDYFKKINLTMEGFMILFTLAFIVRMSCVPIIKRQYEPKIKIKKKSYFTFWDFLRTAPKTNFGRFAIYRSLIACASFISSSLYAIYFLRYLEFTYITYMIITLASTFFSLIFLGLWGKFSDKYGNYRILCITSLLLAITPLLWIMNTSPIYFFFVPALIGGIISSGFTLAVRNFVYDNVGAQKRGLAVSYFNMLQGIGVFIGAGIGALMIKFVKTTSIEPIILIFIIGALIRMVVVFIWIPKLKEVKKTEKIGSMKKLEKFIAREIKPTLSEEIHEIVSIKDYLKE